MKLKSTLIYLLTLAVATSVFAQERYTEDVFTNEEITVTSDVHYATNATIMGLLFNPDVDEFLPEPLFFDVYAPDGAVDDLTDRPVVVVVHGGDGLPMLNNGACWGDKTDTVTVNTAMKLARMGFVAVCPNYRLGWNPLTPNQDAFLDGLVDAGIRIQQDLKATARFLRKTVEMDSNPYGIHPDKIAIWGTASTGGTYAAFAAYINDFAETQTATWFVTDGDGNIYNIYDEAESGNLAGTVLGTIGEGATLDTTNYVNWAEYSSDFQLSVLGSAISLDSGIVNTDEAPMIMLGNPNSVVTQFPVGPIQLPTTGEIVAFVQLSQGLITEANNQGVNDAWAGLDDQWTLAQQADPNFGQQEGWVPLYGHLDNEYPWVWWDEVNCPQNENSADILPEPDRDRGLLQIDTMGNYFGVRACVTLNLNCPSVVSTREVVLADNLVAISPNPTYNTLRIEAADQKIIEQVSILSIDGREMATFTVGSSIFQADNLNLASGIYITLVRFKEGIVAKKLLVR